MHLRDARHLLCVVFKSDCIHSPVNTPHQQLRGADRADLVANAGAMCPAHVHGLASEGRYVEHQLNNDVSTCGASGGSVRNAIYLARRAESRLDPNLILSLQKLVAAGEASDLAATPEADRKDRLYNVDKVQEA